VTVSGTGVEVRGMIDRLDLDGAGRQARVIDYKSGKARHGGDLAGGEELQRALYTNAVRQLLGPELTIDAVLLHPRAGKAIALDDPDAALAQLARAIELAFERLRGGWALPGPDAFGKFPRFPLALPADAEAYETRKADAFEAVLGPVAEALATPAGVEA
jgi:hypothetical protein